jgi:hypothetical protein
VSDADRIVGDHDDTDAVGSEHRQREIWHLGEQPVGRPVISGLFDVDHRRAVDLIDDRPTFGDAEPGAQTPPGIEVATEVSVTGFGEHGEAVNTHP